MITDEQDLALLAHTPSYIFSKYQHSFIRLSKMSRQQDEKKAIIIKKNNKLCHSWNTKSHLVKTMSIVSFATLTILLVARIAHSIIIPPKFYTPFHHNHHQVHSTNGYDRLAADENVPYVLSINEGSSLSVPANSGSAVTVNLNRAVQQDVAVLLTVNSGPDLISFDPVPKLDQPKDSTSNASFIANNVKSLEGTSNCRINYPANTFGDRIVYFHTNNVAGHAEIVAKIIEQPKGITIDDKGAYISIDIFRNGFLNVVIQIVGWIYFLAWSISFYFQFILNYQRKSVVGLNFDFLALNLLGFTCYAIFNATLLFSDSVQHEYYNRYTYSRIPVEYNDLFFAIHAVVITILTAVQCFIYEVSCVHLERSKLQLRRNIPHPLVDTNLTFSPGAPFHEHIELSARLTKSVIYSYHIRNYMLSSCNRLV